MNKKDMLKLLKTYDEAYYSGESIITDEEYDVLKDKYVTKYGEYDFIPNEGNTSFNKVKHKYPLLSLNKLQLNNTEAIKNIVNKLWPVIIENKYDGLSIEIQLDEDNNLRFITRHNGNIGDDVTAQCMKIPGVKYLKLLFSENKDTSYRAEIVMTHDDFNKLNKEREENGDPLFSNCRNAASGMLRNKDLDKVKGLTIILYENLGSIKKESDDIDNMKTILKDIDLTNIRVTDYYEPKDIDDTINKLNTLENIRTSIDYDIDGLVIKSNIEDSLKVFGGYTEHHPKNAIAIKGIAKGNWTTIKSISWQVGKEAITPIAELEPIEIEGSIISRATLHNVSFLKAIGLTYLEYKDQSLKEPLTKVKVVKANDVIPKIIDVKHVCVSTIDEKINDSGFKLNEIYDFSDPIFVPLTKIPEVCPVCGASTIIRESNSDSEILICTGEKCEAKLLAKIEQMCSKDGLNIVGMSEGTIKKIIDTFDIENPTDILNITKEDLLELDGFADKSAIKLYLSIQKTLKEQTMDKVLYSACIPLIGKKAAKDICEAYDLHELNKLFNLKRNIQLKELTKINGIGKEIATSLINNKRNYFTICSYIENIISIKKDNTNATNSKQQYSFCITGAREPYKTLIENAGYKVVNSVSKKTFALINSNNEKSSKAIKAKELGIKIIKTEDELIDLLKELN